MVITDPVWPQCRVGVLQGAEDPAALLGDVLEALPETVERLIIVLGAASDPRILSQVPARWPFIMVQTLPYVLPSPIGRTLIGSEFAYSFGKPPPPRPTRQLMPGWAPQAQPIRKNTIHPAPRSIIHMRWLVDCWTTMQDIILDPFAGSGTIIRAAKDCGRQAIGIEIVPEYAREAQESMAQESMNLEIP